MRILISLIFYFIANNFVFSQCKEAILPEYRIKNLKFANFIDSLDLLSKEDIAKFWVLREDNNSFRIESDLYLCETALFSLPHDYLGIIFLKEVKILLKGEFQDLIEEKGISWLFENNCLRDGVLTATEGATRLVRLSNGKWEVFKQFHIKDSSVK